MNLSKLWAHLGTVLAAVGAGLTDFHAVSAGPTVQGALSAIAGLLVLGHVITSKQAATAETDFHRFTGALAAATEAARRYFVAPPSPPQTPPAAVVVPPAAPPA